MTAALASSTRHEPCTRCRSGGPFTCQAQPWGLYGVCDLCWLLARNNAWRLYRAARRAGTLSPPGHCGSCRRSRRRVVGHHFDYRRPFAVRWLCTTCHAREHKVTGRCAGCGKTAPGTKMRKHVVECPDWLALPPDRQLEPEPEYQRWLAQDRDDERDQRREQAIETTQAARAAVAGRFSDSSDLDRVLDEEVR